MEAALKQRLIGAAVLVALAVIFLPMLIKGPAPESGISDVSLSLPDAPQDGFETRELPLITPGAAPRGGAVGMAAAQPNNDGRLPTVDTSTTGAASADARGADTGMMPAATAGGDYAVSFGSYASSADAARVVAALTSSQLPGYQEATTSSSGRALYRVRIGPYASQAEAEVARLRAAHVRDDVGAKVVVLNAGASPSTAVASRASATVDGPSVSAPVALPAAPAAKPQPLPGAPAAKPAASARADTPAPATTATAATPAATSVSKPIAAASAAAPAPQAAADVGFAVQLGAFGSAAEAGKLRDRARAAGFNAFVQDVRTDKGVLSRVRVGPVLGRAAADQLKGQVSAKLGISGIVQSHP